VCNESNNMKWINDINDNINNINDNVILLMCNDNEILLIIMIL